MDKAVYWGGIVISLALIAGSIFVPASFIMTFASTSLVMNLARILIVGLMVSLIVTNPPRSHAFRAVLGAAAFGFFMWAWNHAMSGTIQLADSILFLQAAVAFALEAVEPASIHIDVDDSDEEQAEVDVRHLKAAKTKASRAIRKKTTAVKARAKTRTARTAKATA